MLKLFFSYFFKKTFKYYWYDLMTINFAILIVFILYNWISKHWLMWKLRYTSTRKECLNYDNRYLYLFALY